MRTLHQPLLVASVPPNIPLSTDIPMRTLVYVVSATQSTLTVAPHHILNACASLLFSRMDIRYGKLAISSSGIKIASNHAVNGAPGTRIMPIISGKSSNLKSCDSAKHKNTIPRINARQKARLCLKSAGNIALIYSFILWLYYVSTSAIPY